MVLQMPEMRKQFQNWIIGRGWKNLEEKARENLDFCEWSISTQKVSAEESLNVGIKWSKKKKGIKWSQLEYWQKH